MPRPFIMVAPNGARRQKSDHPALPVTIPEMVVTATACRAAGADGVHAHIRKPDGAHLLDVGIYSELIAELDRALPGFPVQITTEAAGVYDAPTQREMLKVTGLTRLSAAMREITADEDVAAQTRFYHEAAERDLDLQHIVYSPAEVTRLGALVAEGIIPAVDLSLLFVLGKYVPPTDGQPDELAGFLAARDSAGLGAARFMLCAFGANETACLVAAARAGGDCRIGFENSLTMDDGTRAPDNAARVAQLVSVLAANGLR